MLQFSLIVCTRGRPHLLKNLLLGIGLLRYPAFELIVVHDPNDTQTGQCIANHAPAARIGHCVPANVAKARNIGLAAALGDIAAFIDDDAVPEPDWLDRLAVAYARQEVTAAGGVIRGPNGVRMQSREVLIDPFGTDHHAQSRANLPAGWFTSLTGTNFSVRRDAALAIGGFDENYPYFLEETDFLLRLSQAGGKVCVADHAEVHHKYAASDMRDQYGTPKSLHTIARSKAYFCYVNRQPGAAPAAIGRALARFTTKKTWVIGLNLLSGRLSFANAARLSTELRIGMEDGAALAACGRALPVSSAPAALQFENFHHRPPRQRLCVLIDTTPETCRQWLQIRALAQSGYEITVIYFGASLFPRVSFVNGIWQHRLSAARRVFRSTAAIASELRRISPHRQFEKICVVSNRPGFQKALAANGLPICPAGWATSTRSDKMAETCAKW